MSTEGYTFDLQRLFWTQTTDHHLNISLLYIQVCLQISTQFMKLCEHSVIFLVKTQIETYLAFCELVL